MVTYINIDTILSDPLLLTATILLVVGPILFLVSLWNLVRTPKKKDPLFDPHAPANEEEPVVHQEKKAVAPPAPKPVPVAEPKPSEPAKAPTPPPMAAIPKPMDMESTVVMPPGMAEIQGQLEIAFSQIKHLNKKVFDLENSLASGSAASAAGGTEEVPGNVSELAQKLLKLAEHVIVLEKNVNKLMANKPSMVPTDVTQPKPPIMPL
jgi:hypothetical protein